MTALPALSMIATDAIRRTLAATEPPVPDRRRVPPAPSRARLALAALLERTARAVAPTGYRPAH